MKELYKRVFGPDKYPLIESAEKQPKIKLIHTFNIISRAKAKFVGKKKSDKTIESQARIKMWQGKIGLEN